MNRLNTNDLDAIIDRDIEHPRVPIGAVVGHWPCPSCDRSITVVHRPGRPRLYCSQACRQRAYRWRRRHRAHTTSTMSWPAESAWVSFGKHHHALRTRRDPMSRRRDHTGREVTACGVLARPKTRQRARGDRAPFLRATPATCRSCEALTEPRPLGLVPPDAMPPPRSIQRDGSPSIDALRALSPRYPLDPALRHLLSTLWAA